MASMDEHIGFRISSERHEAIKEFANRHDVTMTVAARAVLRTGIESDDLEIKLHDFSEKDRQRLEDMMRVTECEL